MSILTCLHQCPFFQKTRCQVNWEQVA